MGEPTIRVIDSPMGTGKTRYIFREIESNPDKKYIYVTPYLDECKRLVAACPQHDFKTPIDTFSKQSSFESLIKDGENIAISHKLLTQSHFSAKVKQAIHDYGYSLILDEEIDVIEPISITQNDISILINSNIIRIEKDGLVKWIDDKYEGKLKSYRTVIRNNAVIYYNDEMFLWILPIDTLKVFLDITIITFLFKRSHLDYYLRINHLNYDLYYIDANRRLAKGRCDLAAFKAKAAKLIDVYEGHLNNIGEKETALSASWHKQGENQKVVSNNARVFFEKTVKSKCEEALWTMFMTDKRSKESKPKYPIKNYIKSSAPCNSRATNEYSNRKYAAYLINVYDNPYIRRYFNEYNITLDDNALALSRMLQWIWRTCIRNDQPLKLYIPSSRMRNLLKDWLGIAAGEKKIKLNLPVRG